MTEQGDTSANHQYYQSTNQEQQVFIPAGHTTQHPTQMQYTHPQTLMTIPSRQPQEQMVYQHQQADPRIAPLSTNFHPQTYVPRHGYSSYFPPEQINKDKERITQLDRMLDASLSRQQGLAEENKNLKKKTEQEGPCANHTSEYELIASEVTTSEDEEYAMGKGGYKEKSTKYKPKGGRKEPRDPKSPRGEKKTVHHKAKDTKNWKIQEKRRRRERK